MDFKSKMRDLLNSTLGENTQTNGQSFPFNSRDYGTKSAQTKPSCNLYGGYNISNSKTPSGKVGGFDFSLESFKKDRNSSAKKSMPIFRDPGDSQIGYRSQNKGKSLNNSLNNVRTYGSHTPQTQKKPFDALKTIDQLFNNKGNGREREDNYSSDFNNLKTKKSNLEETKTTSISYSALNKSRDNSLNYSTYNSGQTRNNYLITESRTNDSYSLANHNVKLRKEIASISNSIQNTPGIIKSSANRPHLYLNRPDLEVNSKGYLEFSPTNTKKNILITSNLLKNYNSHSGQSTNKDFTNSFNNSHNKGSQKNNNFSFNFKSVNSNAENNFKANGFRQSFIPEPKDNRFISEKRGEKIPDSVDDFSNQFNTSPKKLSFIERFSPKKKNKDMPRFFGVQK